MLLDRGEDAANLFLGRSDQAIRTAELDVTKSVEIKKGVRVPSFLDAAARSPGQEKNKEKKAPLFIR